MRRRSGGGDRWALWRWQEIPCAVGPPQAREIKPYLTRLRLIQTPWFGVMLHWIHQPDAGRDLHDHPWSFVSVVLRGAYSELVSSIPTSGDCPQRAHRHRAGRWHLIRAGWAHRIRNVEPGTLTLVLTGRRRRDWGFYRGVRSFGGFLLGVEFIPFDEWRPDR